jgi:activator of HSP90 ATPase
MVQWHICAIKQHQNSEETMAQKDPMNARRGNKLLPRRDMIIAGGIGLASLSIIRETARAGPAMPGEKSNADDASTSIHQEIDLKGTPQRVYEALLDSKQFTAFSGAPAEIHAEAGGTFSCFGGVIVGRNVELVPGRRIVQAWRSNGWSEGSYSIVKFELNQQGAGTRLVMDHRGFPDGLREHLEAGWKEHYWEPLSKYLS